jgi:four helix bundle protein
MHNLQELKVWQKAMTLATQVYEITKDFPNEEKYGLTSQIRRAAVSIPSNIAEGAGRNSSKEFVHFLAISNGSAYELQTQLIISNNLKLIDSISLKTLLDQLSEIQKMNYTFQKTLINKNK